MILLARHVATDHYIFIVLLFPLSSSFMHFSVSTVQQIFADRYISEVFLFPFNLSFMIFSVSISVFRQIAANR